jgi:hypothetical protein
LWLAGPALPRGATPGTGNQAGILHVDHDGCVADSAGVLRHRRKLEDDGGGAMGGREPRYGRRHFGVVQVPHLAGHPPRHLQELVPTVADTSNGLRRRKRGDSGAKLRERAKPGARIPGDLVEGQEVQVESA